jgi:Tat protein secretion system quality control protein TatD with DNase activity
MGRLSEPADVWLTVEAVARLKDLEPGEVARVSTRNTETLFHMSAP